MAQLEALATERVDLYASALESELARYAYLPSLIAVNSEVARLLDQPGNAALTDQTSRVLARIAARSGASLVFITGQADELLAASNIDLVQPSRLSPNERLPDPVAAVRQQMAEGQSDFFASNKASQSTDYYFTQELRRQAGTVGHIVVKINLAALEATWVDMGERTQSERLLVVDHIGDLVLSSVPDWKQRRLLEGAEAGKPAPGHSLRLITHANTASGAALARTSVDDDTRPGRPMFLVQDRYIARLGARMVSLSDPSEVWRSATISAWGGAAGGAFLGMLGLYLVYRQRAMKQLFAASNALKREHEQLEMQVDQRTLALREANEQLKSQIAQRMQAEDELLQASKMAVFGQLSAAISHEVSQPLTALRSLSHNTVRLLEVGQVKAAADNLRAIDDMAVRMGKIITQMKTFARKGQASAEPVEVAVAIQNVLLMVDHRLRQLQIEVQVDTPRGLRIVGDLNRLEQVLLNLSANAIDAMASSPQRQLTINASRLDGRVRLSVSDTGSGMDEAQIQRLFEPFFTTKPPGEGLGLGLVISSKIVNELGGTLVAQRTTQGMCFSFELKATEADHV